MLHEKAGDFKGNKCETTYHNKPSTLSNLPTEVLLDISEELNILDRAALALSCKDVAAKLETHNHLDWDGPNKYVARQPNLPFPFDALLYFFQETLANGWVPRTLRYCQHSRKFVPRDNTEF